MKGCEKPDNDPHERTVRGGASRNTFLEEKKEMGGDYLDNAKDLQPKAGNRNLKDTWMAPVREEKRERGHKRWWVRKDLEGGP